MPEPAHNLPAPDVSHSPAKETRADEPAASSNSATGLVQAPSGYELLDEIGRGGMGVVFRARDIALNRSVAIKFLQDDFPTDGAGARRFTEEAQITGQLQHPGIPPVHQVGTLPNGRPYLVMKLIKGRNLDHILSERTTPQVDRGRFLAVFEQICQAVGYAHSHNIIHRDLKPANVMVGAFGEVQVMDWGLAKPLLPPESEADPVESRQDTEIRSPRDRDSATRTGSFMGTPAFMSPEQAEGDISRIDTRSDVFALGAILCVILTGRPPHRGSDPQAIRIKSIRGDLSDAMERLAAAGAEPDLIDLTRQCLACERDDRPNDAYEVAAAIARWRSAAEERARKAELDRVRADGERAKAAAEAREQRKRRKVQLALAGMVLITAAGGAAVALWQQKQTADRKANEARLAGERDSEARNKTEQARQGVAANLALADYLRRQYRFAVAGRVLTQAAEQAINGAPELLPQVERATRDLAIVVQLDDIRYRKWSWVSGQGGRGHFSGRTAPAAYHSAFLRQGLDLVRLDPAEAVKQIAASHVRIELVAAVDDWALNEENLDLQRRLLTCARLADPDPWFDRLRNPDLWRDRAAVANLAANTDMTIVPPRALNLLAGILGRNNQSPQPALSAARAAHPDDFELAFLLGQWHTSRGHHDEALGAYEAARALRPDNPAVWNNLGTALHRKGSPDEAISAYAGAIARDPAFAPAHINMGQAYQAKGNLDEAIAAFKKAVEAAPDIAAAHYNLGIGLYNKNDFGGSAAAFRQAVRLDAGDPNSQIWLGMALADSGDVKGAIASFEQAIRLDPGDPKAHYNLGIMLLESRQHQRAIDEFQETIRLDPMHFKAHEDLAGLYLHQRRHAEAIVHYRAALKLNPKESSSHAMLGIALQRSGDIAGAREALTEAARLDKRWAELLAKLRPVTIAPPPRVANRK